MNLPSFQLPVALDRPVPTPAPAAAEATPGRDRPTSREEAFDHALAQQLVRQGAGPAGRGTPPPSAAALSFAWLEVLSNGDGTASPAWEEPDASLAPRGLGALLRGWEPPTEARPREPEPADDVGLVAPLLLPLPQVAFPPLEGEPEPISVPDLPRAVLGQVRWTVERQQPLTQLDFHLSPPALGPVHLQVSYTEGVVGVQLTALTLQARQSLESQVGQIQAILQSHNLAPGTVRVVAPAAGRAGASGSGLRQDPGGLGAGLAGRRRQAGAADEAIREA
ncbi:MAG: flagellar hook-length control protein FliK [Candidatus Sericytochromatia bacterium]|nr:flagellar hook-length control protein FliK [Candidatus Sericytochromatia bacterium]